MKGATCIKKSKCMSWKWINMAGVLARRYALFPLLLFLLVSCGKGGSVVGKEAPPFKLDLLEGGQIGISDLRGKPVILYFFASW